MSGQAAGPFRLAVPALLLLGSPAAAAPSCAAPGEAAAAAPAVDARVELLSALLLRGSPPGAARTEKSPYRRDAESWFAAYADHPAAARAAELLALDPRLPARIVLRLSPPPELAVVEPIPDAVLDAAGGRAAASRFIDSLADFARRSRFTDFYEAHRADYLAFSARAEEEELSSPHPRAVRAYLGADPAGRRSFILAPLLPEAAASAFTVERCGRVDEVLFDRPGSSEARELVRGAVAALDPNAGAEVQEPLAAAVLLRVLAQDLGEPIYLEMLRRYAGRGAAYVGPLGERLKEYEAHRDRYKTLKDFHPRLASVFRESVPEEEISAPPEDAEPRRLKDAGVKDFVERRFGDAVQKFKAALALAPRDSEALLDLGVVYETLGRKAEALESYDRAIEFSDARSARGAKVKAAAVSSRAALRGRERGSP